MNRFFALSRTSHGVLDIAAPAFCDLEESPEEQLLRRYLKIWKIEKDADDLATAA